MDTDRLAHFTVKYGPSGKEGNGYTSQDFRLLLEPDLVTWPNPLLLLLLLLPMIIILILCNGNEYFQTLHLQNCDALAKVHFKFRHFVMCILQK
jgi:hypothetical protein